MLNTCLALRHAIWCKADPARPVCGVPDVRYVDHGSDFTSRHLDRVAADLRFRGVCGRGGAEYARHRRHIALEKDRHLSLKVTP